MKSYRLTVDGITVKCRALNFQVKTEPLKFYRNRSPKNSLAGTFDLKSHPLPFNNAIAALVWLALVKANKFTL
jgi:hypothetical protein